MAVYISPTGSNTNSGTQASPWLTLSYACSHVTSGIIYVNAGTYLETNECILPVGVSIEGAGKTTTIIKSHYYIDRGALLTNGTIRLGSPSGTNGNQSISNITLDGDGMIGGEAITIYGRSNVIIHDCIIKDFYISGIYCYGFDGYSLGTNYATGNKVYNCTLSNCGDTEGTWDGGGLLYWGGQDGMEAYDNTFTHNSRPAGHNGDVVMGIWNKGIKLYRNKFYKNDTEAGEWNFVIEMANSQGGYEVFNNEFHGSECCIDCGTYPPGGGGNIKGSYAYSWYIHDNLFTTSTGNNIPINYGESCINIEGVKTEGIWIYNNHMVSRGTFVRCDNGTSWANIVSDIQVCYNLLENVGWNAAGWDERFNYFNDNGGVQLTNVLWYNNVLIANNLTKGSGISIINNSSTITNFNIKNNIFIHCHYNGFLDITNGGTFNGLHVDNNDLYDNSRNTPFISGTTPINYTLNNNITGNPLFVSASDFHLQSSSPCINKGVDVGLTKDYEGNIVSSVPDIGVYEFNNNTMATITTDKGTYQVTAVVLPVDATDKSLTWSITGPATVSQTGLVTATGDGTAIVKATAKDGSGVFGTLPIVITGQRILVTSITLS
jgi:hypothetical protein